MKWIGLTGGIASGKSSVSQILRSLGFSVVDADAIAKKLAERGEPGLSALVAEFGPQILKPDASLDRKKLGEIVFQDPQKLLKLESILHPLVRQETQKQKDECQRRGEALAFYDVPLLFEKQMEKEFDAVIVVSAHETLQKQRMRLRDQLTEAEIESRLKAQIPLFEKTGKATWVIHNVGSLEELKAATIEIVRKIQSGKA